MAKKIKRNNRRKRSSLWLAWYITIHRKESFKSQKRIFQVTLVIIVTDITPLDNFLWDAIFWLSLRYWGTIEVSILYSSILVINPWPIWVWSFLLLILTTIKLAKLSRWLEIIKFVNQIVNNISLIWNLAWVNKQQNM